MKVITRQEAIALKLKRYFTGKSCKHSHISERYLDRRCVDCDRSRSAINRKKNTAKANARTLKWQKDNKEKANKRQMIGDLEIKNLSTFLHQIIELGN